MISQLWDHRALILAVAVAFLLALCAHQRDQLAARPEVADSVQKSSDSHEERGKVTIHERFAPAAPATAACPNPKPQLLERETIKEPSVIDRKAESASTHIEKPLAPAAPLWRYVSVTLDVPSFMPRRVGAGVTWWGRLDTGGDYDFKYHAAGVESRLRF